MDEIHAWYEPDFAFYVFDGGAYYFIQIADITPHQ
jgi:hypothetical protein